MKIITTHGGAFHADDIFAVATLILVLKEEYTIVRTRDEALFADSDYLIDVGGVLDPSKGRFDHHQQGGAGERKNGIPYASFGLLWNTYGLELCGGNAEAMERIDNLLVVGIDAIDNGVEIFTNLHKGVYPYTIGNFFQSFHPSGNATIEDNDRTFINCVNLAKDLLAREILNAIEQVTLQQKVIEIYQKAGDKRVLILDGRYPWGDVVQRFPEPLFVVYPDRNHGERWSAKAVRVDPMSFTPRKKYPESWAGKSNEEFRDVSGVSDAVFCHRDRFLVVAKSREGAVKLAEIAANA